MQQSSRVSKKLLFFIHDFEENMHQVYKITKTVQ